MKFKKQNTGDRTALFLNGAWFATYSPETDSWGFDLPENAQAVAAWWEFIANEHAGDVDKALAGLEIERD